jgi:hypothetical protein
MARRISGRQYPKGRTAQRGAVAVLVGLALAVLVGFAGLALDLGHLYVTKTELQDAADACALAASRELTCDTGAGPCGSSYLEDAENAGLAVGTRNKAGFQGSAVSIAREDVRFSTTFTPNSNYLSRADGADPASKYVMCITRRTGIAPWFMQVLGFGPQAVGAFAVATLSPAQTNCAMPIGVCMPSTGTPSNPFAGLQVGQWLTSKLTSSATGSFSWIDFTPTTGGGAREIADMIRGSGACSLPPPPTPVGQQGNITSLGMAWNTRFGLYKGSESITTATPDFTGYAYTPTSWPEKSDAYSGTSTTGAPNFLASRAAHAPYQGPASGLDISNSFRNSTSTDLATYGADRRLAVVPIVDCSAWASSNPQQQPVLGYACVLLLHPMDKDNGPGATDEVWLEYRGQANDPTSPCATAGGVGGPGSVGPLVPALVQ